MAAAINVLKSMLLHRILIFFVASVLLICASVKLEQKRPFKIAKLDSPTLKFKNWKSCQS